MATECVRRKTNARASSKEESFRGLRATPGCLAKSSFGGSELHPERYFPFGPWSFSQTTSVSTRIAAPHNCFRRDLGNGKAPAPSTQHHGPRTQRPSPQPNPSTPHSHTSTLLPTRPCGLHASLPFSPAYPPRLPRRPHTQPARDSPAQQTPWVHVRRILEVEASGDAHGGGSLG